MGREVLDGGKKDPLVLAGVSDEQVAGLTQQAANLPRLMRVVDKEARVVTGADCEPVNVAMRKKYAIQFRLLEWTTAITSRIKRQSVADAAVIVDFS